MYRRTHVWDNIMRNWGQSLAGTKVVSNALKNSKSKRGGVLGRFLVLGDVLLTSKKVQCRKKGLERG